MANSENSTALSRAPVSLWEPNETLRLMAGALSARSEALLSIGVAGSSTNTDSPSRSRTRARNGAPLRVPTSTDPQSASTVRSKSSVQGRSRR